MLPAGLADGGDDPSRFFLPVAAAGAGDLDPFLALEPGDHWDGRDEKRKRAVDSRRAPRSDSPGQIRKVWGGDQFVPTDSEAASDSSGLSDPPESEFKSESTFGFELL